ncbi:MAG: hypothetical protein Q7S84_02795 [bacterium]|nr:hypothetical protein [bacterium]
MKRKYFLCALILGFGITLSVFIAAGGVSAQTGGAADIQYPVPELGNCANEAACRTYCDVPANLSACLTFAETHDLMSRGEVAMARRFEKVGTGPGGCTGRESCDRYCDNIAHIDECISFAEEHDLIPPEELAEARKVQVAIARGVKPPPCGGKQACDRYCSEPNHMEECITFGREAGLMSPEEAVEVDKVLAAVKRGVKPPPCRGKQACDRYCSEPNHMEECMTFAQAAGFMSPQEAEDAEKMLAAVKKGVKPPACRGKEACDRYCGDEAHTDECIAFAEAAGFMKPAEVAMARRTGGKGPGGCRGKDACEAFCGNQANQEICFNFGKEHGLIPEEDVRRMEAGKARFGEELRQAPPEIAECLKATVGEEVLAKLERGEGFPQKDLGEKMRSCFERMGPRPSEVPPRRDEGGPPRGEFPGGPPGAAGPGVGVPPGEFHGPGGCTSPEECRAYCAESPEACAGFGPRAGEGFREGERLEVLDRRSNFSDGGSVPRPSEAFREGGPRPGTVPRRDSPPTGGENAPYGMRRENGSRPPEGAGQIPFFNCKTPEECALFKDRVPEEFRTMMEQGVSPMRYPGSSGPGGEGFEGRVPFPQSEPPHPGESAPPPPSSFSPHTFLGLLFKILTGR